jgi:hypothetical protein
MRKLLLTGALATASLGVMLGIATATPPGGDYAAGNGNDGTGHFVFRAQQASTFLATGRMSYRSPTQVVRARVICLNVQGDLAFILGEIDQSRSSGIPGGSERVAFEVRDAPGADAFSIFFANPVLGCALPPFSGVPIVRGHIVVRDSTP